MCNPTTSPRGVFTGEVVANESLCSEHGRMTIAVHDFPPSRPGQFIQLQCRPVRQQVSAHEVEWVDHGPDAELPQFTHPELTDTEPLLRRPFSLAGRRDGENRRVELDLIYRTVGTGSSYLATVDVGSELSLLGPLGNALPIIEGKAHAALVGGGVGIPPMLYLAEAMQLAGKQAVAFNGVRSHRLLPLTPTDVQISPEGTPAACLAEFARVGCDAVVTTDDGTVGYHGLVSDALLRYLRTIDTDDLVVYACGPEPMMRAVGDLCVEIGIECYLSLERIMACGMGTCQSCIVKVHDASTEAGWAYKLCCTHGPVFEARQLIW
jgi:dihydroorotate dehydrogenase electron transfer subunit